MHVSDSMVPAMVVEAIPPAGWKPSAVALFAMAAQETEQQAGWRQSCAELATGYASEQCTQDVEAAACKTQVTELQTRLELSGVQHLCMCKHAYVCIYFRMLVCICINLMFFLKMQF